MVKNSGISDVTDKILDLSHDLVTHITANTKLAAALIVTKIILNLGNEIALTNEHKSMVVELDAKTVRKKIKKHGLSRVLAAYHYKSQKTKLSLKRGMALVLIGSGKHAFTILAVDIDSINQQTPNITPTNHTFLYDGIQYAFGDIEHFGAYPITWNRTGSVA